VGRIYDGSGAANDDRYYERQGRVKGKGKHHKPHDHGDDDRN
jgi:hypothetical protein